MLRDPAGGLYVWVAALEDGKPAAQPRAYRLPYAKDLHALLGEGMKKVRQGVSQMGTAEPKVGSRGLAWLRPGSDEQVVKIRDLQDETGGFTAFFCWDFQHEKGTHIAPGDNGTHLYLRQQAVARLMLDNVDHVGASWVTQGPAVGQVALRFGADDFGSVMFEENVVSSAGTTFRIGAEAIEARIHEAGFKATRRNVRYDWLTEPSAPKGQPA